MPDRSRVNRSTYIGTAMQNTSEPAYTTALKNIGQRASSIIDTIYADLQKSKKSIRNISFSDKNALSRQVQGLSDVCSMAGVSSGHSSVFGTHVLGASDRWLNIYADYEMATGSVCDALSLRIYYEDGREESLEYRLNAIEKATLLRKMDAYCLQQTGQSLKDYSAGLMAEEEIAPPAGPAL